VVRQILSEMDMIVQTSEDVSGLRQKGIRVNRVGTTWHKGLRARSRGQLRARDANRLPFLGAATARLREDAERVALLIHIHSPKAGKFPEVKNFFSIPRPRKIKFGAGERGGFCKRGL
jgi:hypothetical protein